MGPQNARRALHFLPFVCSQAIVLRALQPQGGLIGHDCYHEFTRLLIGALHFWLNGLDIPHYTARVCAGVPFFANPQSDYYSIPQLLTFLVDPLRAAQITVVLFYCVGYAGCLRLFDEILDCGEEAAHLASLLFALNGFAFAHLFVGHLNHCTYLLLPWVIYFLLKPLPPAAAGRAKHVAWFSLILVYTFYSGGMHMLVVSAVVFVLLLPYLVYRKSREGQLRAFVLFLVASAGCFAAACSGKLVASYLYSATFYIRSIDRFDHTPLSLVARYFWFRPSMTPLFEQFTDFLVGPWEYVGFLSKASIPLSILFVFGVLAALDRPKIRLCVIYQGLIPLVVLVAVGSDLNRFLPFFKHYHNPIKILAAFIPLLVLVGAVPLRRLARGRVAQRLSPSGRTVGVLVLGLGLVAEFWSYTDFFVANKLGLEWKYDPGVYRRLKQDGVRPAVDHVVMRPNADADGVAFGFTSLLCYEPVFGYRHETFASTVTPGATSLVRDGRFNLNHPGCLVYPAYFGCAPWDRIPASDRESLDRLVRGQTPRWGVPPWQSALIAANVIFLVALMAVAFFPGGPPGRGTR